MPALTAKAPSAVRTGGTINVVTSVVLILIVNIYSLTALVYVLITVSSFYIWVETNKSEIFLMNIIIRTL